MPDCHLNPYFNPYNFLFLYLKQTFQKFSLKYIKYYQSLLQQQFHNYYYSQYYHSRQATLCLSCLLHSPQVLLRKICDKCFSKSQRNQGFDNVCHYICPQILYFQLTRKTGILRINKKLHRCAFQWIFSPTLIILCITRIMHHHRNFII